LSRRRELYFKELIYDSLADLVLEFKRSYERVFHTLKRVKVGLPMSHDPVAGEFVFWDYLLVRFSDINAATEKLAEHGRTAHKLHDQWKNEVKKGAGTTSGPPRGPVVRLDSKKGAEKGKKPAEERGLSGDSDSSDGEVSRASLDEGRGEADSSTGADGSSTDGKFMGTENNGAAARPRPSFLAV